MNRTSSWTIEQFRSAVEKSTTIAETLRRLGLSSGAGNYRVFHRTVKENNLNTSHFLGLAWVRDKKRKALTHRLLKDILVKDSPYRGGNQRVKARLIKKGLIEDRCSICGQEPWWNNGPLVLQLDHINGDPFDFRIDNLRVICPHCHSQTDNFRGRRSRGLASATATHTLLAKSVRAVTCLGCGKQISPSAMRCRTCAGLFNRKLKIDWPPLSEIEKMLSSSNYSAVGRRLGVSDNAVRKHIQSVIKRSGETGKN